MPKKVARPKRANGEGSVVPRKLKSGATVYDVWVTYRDRATGKPGRYVKKGSKSEAEAKEHRDEQVVKARKRELVNPSAQRFSDYLDGWLEGHRVKQQTKEGYRNKIRLHVKPHIGNIAVGKLTTGHLDRLYRTLETKGSPKPAKGPLSARTIREIHTIISASLKDATLGGLLSFNPASMAKPPTTKEAAPPEFTVWTADQLRTFLHAERETPQFGLWHFLATTGVRRGEALGLRWHDIDFDHKTAVIRQTVGAIRGKVVREPLPKSSKPRVIDLDANTIKILKAHKAAQAADKLKLGSRYVEEGLVFARGSVRLREGQDAGGPLHPERTSRLFDARISSHGLPDIRLHDLRHTWATLALKSGIPVKVVQERLGHANPTITMNIYAHVIKGMQAEAAETVASLFA